MIDLSADYRLPTPALYERWYGNPHTQADLLSQTVYGLCEVNRDQIAGADLVANPGCYPTSINLGLWPLAQAGMLGPTIIADSKSGVSGAGRKLRLNSHFVEANENFSPYSIGYSHRHIAEMEMILGPHVVGDIDIIFSPHLLPVNRGILSTIYIEVDPALSEQDVREIYAQYICQRSIHPSSTSWSACHPPPYCAQQPLRNRPDAFTPARPLDCHCQ